MIPLLSIVVPTKNRYYYLEFLVQYFNSIKSDKIELIIQDNSVINSNDEFVKFLNSMNDSRIKYFYEQGDISQPENCDNAVSKATGEYVTMIGDDDIFSKHIIEFTEKFKEENIDAILPYRSSYLWSDVKPKYYKNQLSGVYSIKEFNLKRRKIDIKKELKNVLNQGGVHILNLPRVYHGIMKRRILEKIYHETGSFFPGPSPDMANAIASCKYISNYQVIDIPLIVSGHSILSAGGQGTQGQHLGEISQIKQLPKDTSSNWSPEVPFYWSGGTIYAESVIQSLKRTGMEEYLKEINFEYLIANCFVFDVNFKDRIFKVYNSKGFLFKTKVNYYVLLIWIKRINFHLKKKLSLYVPFLNFNNIDRFKKSNTMEVALQNDELINDSLLNYYNLDEN
jgi:hypothetical protein